MKHIKEELWKPLVHSPEMNGRYEISNLGNIRSISRWVHRRGNKLGSAPSKYWMEGGPIICQAKKEKDVPFGIRHIRMTHYDDDGRESLYITIKELMKTHWPDSNYTEEDWRRIGKRARKVEKPAPTKSPEVEKPIEPRPAKRVPDLSIKRQQLKNVETAIEALFKIREDLMKEILY